MLILNFSFCGTLLLLGYIQFVSGTVTNLSVISIFPLTPLSIKWSPPQTPNGEIVQYMILVLNSNGNECLLNMSINCTGCANNITVPEWPDQSNKGCKTVDGTTFDVTNSSFAIVMNDARIEPYKRYTISVTPLNGYGWGNMTSTSLTTGQYVSGAVANLSAKSKFLLTPLFISWSPPQTPNGEIVQYVILVLHSNSNGCLLSMSINCTGCTNNITVPEWPDQSSKGCKVVDGTTFNVTNSSFAIVMNDAGIEPYKRYTISVTPLNGYGWGNMTNTSLTTGQYISGPVENLSVNSSFPLTPLSIKWSPPQKSNGTIVQYVILVLHSNNNKCLLNMSISCTGCSNKITVPKWPDQNNEGCKEVNGTTFNATNSSFAIVMNDASIEAYKRYTISVTPMNGYGWGNMTNTSVTTGQYSSSAVDILSVKSAFPKDNLQMVWTPPTKPNGIIVQYLIHVFHSQSCIISAIMNCSNCNNSNAGDVGSKKVICNSTAEGSSFRTDNQSLSLNITNTQVLPQSVYNITIIPINGYGWGAENTTVITTTTYVPDVVTKLLSSVNGSCLSISWTPPKQQPLNFTYFIQLSNKTNIANYTADKSNITYSFPCLEYCSQYQICIRMDNHYRNSNMTCVSNTTDLATAAIDNISFTTMGNSISLSWTYSKFSNCNISFTVTCNGSSYNTLLPNYNLSGLNYFANYTIEVVPLTTLYPNFSRRGVSKSIKASTDQGKPGPVFNFSCGNTSYTAIRCTWGPPRIPNGIILNYTINYTSNFGNEISTNVSNGGNSWSFSEGIAVEIPYIFRISGLTIAGYGDISSSNVRINASIKPFVKNEDSIPEVMRDSTRSVANSQTQMAITLPYKHFTNEYGVIQKFTVVISQIDYDLSLPFSPSQYYNKDYQTCVGDKRCTYEVQPPSGRKKRAVNLPLPDESFIIGSDETCNGKDGFTCNGPLLSDTSYIIGFRTYTNVGFYTFGNIRRSTKPNLIMPIVLGVLVPVFILSIIVGAYFYVRYQRNRIPRPVEASPGTDSLSTASLAFIDNKSPTVLEFQNHFELMQRDSNGRMIDDFQEIRDIVKILEDQKRLVFSEGNDMKNRYNNIKPYRHNRVKLLCQNDYVNASRICVRHWNMDIEKQCDCPDIYIATQGPLGDSKESKVSTMGDFWRMIFENNVCVIVNLTRCEESGREKCAQYWPASIGEKITYRSNGEAIDVVLQRANDNPIVTEREIQISMRGTEMSVIQLHMIAWLDHSCPKSIEFLQFYASYQKVKVPNRTVVVHCSAGVGRTGTFILIDEELSRISRPHDKVEIFNNLLKLRKCRCQMVQTESQYCFVYAIIHDYLIQKGLINLSKAGGDHSDSSELCRQSYENPIFNEAD